LYWASAMKKHFVKFIAAGNATFTLLNPRGGRHRISDALVLIAPDGRDVDAAVRSIFTPER